MTLLPETLRQPYLELQQQLVAMQTMLLQSHSAAANDPSSLHINDLQQSVQAAQQHFHRHIMVPSEGLELEPRVQSAQIEINRLFRLLTMDAAFLRSSRQPTTQNQRLQQVSDRLTHLLDFCQGLL